MFKSINNNLNFRALLSTDICRIILSLSVLCSELFYTNYSALLNDSFAIYPKGLEIAKFEGKRPLLPQSVCDLSPTEKVRFF